MAVLSIESGFLLVAFIDTDPIVRILKIKLNIDLSRG
jgi:hypothetical protein